MTAKAQQTDTVISVANPGVGIPAENIPRLFDRFYRCDPSRSESASSAGLGLTIVQSIMTLHGGRVEAESILNQTTTFTLSFPLNEATGTA
jgi:two-component system, OmpR family, heavy metal sensor histidine kinase CusS